MKIEPIDIASIAFPVPIYSAICMYASYSEESAVILWLFLVFSILLFILTVCVYLHQNERGNNNRH